MNIKKSTVLTKITDVESHEFKEFQDILLKKAEERTKEQNKLIELASKKFKKGLKTLYLPKN